MRTVGPVILYPKKISIVGLLITCAIFVAIGVWMAISGLWVGWLCIGFFGIGLPVFIVQLFPESTYLRLDADGFTYCSLFRRRFVSWEVIKQIYVVTLRQDGANVQEIVGYDYVDDYDHSRIGLAVSKAMGMSEGVLPDTYGKKAEALAALMNDYLAMSKTT